MIKLFKKKTAEKKEEKKVEKKEEKKIEKAEKAEEVEKKELSGSAKIAQKLNSLMR